MFPLIYAKGRSWRCGENGAGKSTLIKVLTGVYSRDAGTITLNGEPITPHNTAQAQEMGIGTVYQEVNMLPNMSVADNLYIGREPRRFGMIDRRKMVRDADALMRNFGFSLDVTRPLGHYSVAMQQIIAICRAVDLSAQVLILDEPTASLDASEVEMLFTLMAQLKAKGMSLIFVTHFLLTPGATELLTGLPCCVTGNLSRLVRPPRCHRLN